MRRRWLAALAAGLILPTAAPAADPKPAERFEVPYRLTETKHVLVRVKLNGKGPFNLILDTGAPAVFITKAVAKKAGVDPDDNGWANFKAFEVEGGVAVEKARARVEDLFQLEGMNGMGLAGVELHGVVGYNVLARYRIQYDFTADKLVWEPLAGFDPPPLNPVGRGGGQGGLEVLGPVMKFMAGMLGIKVNFATAPRGFVGVEVEERDGGVFVKAVLPNSPAAAAGLKAGDRFDLIRNVDIDTGRDLTRALAKATAGEKLKVRVRRGDKTETLTVELGKGL